MSPSQQLSAEKMTPRERAQIGAAAKWAKTEDRPAATAAARTEFLSHFETPEDKKAHFTELGRKSQAAQRANREAKDAARARTASWRKTSGWGDPSPQEQRQREHSDWLNGKGVGRRTTADDLLRYMRTIYPDGLHIHEARKVARRGEKQTRAQIAELMARGVIELDRRKSSHGGWVAKAG